MLFFLYIIFTSLLEAVLYCFFNDKNELFTNHYVLIWISYCVGLGCCCN
ncbi:hypothetical protein MtrunA17_Chr3g0086261 [Medicago truncatula]|uniref:Uncharacterized protein n=1 Tax=Medicago truncatula TaxID=3880 RepID=A0A396IMK8_MEDTR|nr:hypothetical protein MtrunA17_Chr3g0086261 [Medicago truncatula]